MSSQGGQQGEVFNTDGAVKGFRVRMNDLMVLQVSFPAESLFAQQALKRPLSCVNPDVFGQMLYSGKALPTLRALERLRSGRNTQCVVICGDV